MITCPYVKQKENERKYQYKNKETDYPIWTKKSFANRGPRIMKWSRDLADISEENDVIWHLGMWGILSCGIFGEEMEKFLKHKLMSTVIIRFKKNLTPKKATSHHVLTTSVSENNKHLLRSHPIEWKKNLHSYIR